MDPLHPSAPGSHYERQLQAQERGSALDVFAVLGMPANNNGFMHFGATRHYERRIVKHVPEQEDATPRTVGPLVPLRSHVDIAKKMLLDHCNPEDFEEYKVEWSQHSAETWNPFAPVGSAEALRTRRSTGFCMLMSFPSYWLVLRP